MFFKKLTDLPCTWCNGLAPIELTQCSSYLLLVAWLLVVLVKKKKQGRYALESGMLFACVMQGLEVRQKQWLLTILNKVPIIWRKPIVTLLQK